MDIIVFEVWSIYFLEDASLIGIIVFFYNFIYLQEFHIKFIFLSITCSSVPTMYIFSILPKYQYMAWTSNNMKNYFIKNLNTEF